MLRNPEIKLDGQPIRQYLFPKYPGKFFAHVEKLRQSQIIKKQTPFRSKDKIISFSCKEDYKQTKAEADYIQRIQNLKKRLQKEIKKSNQQKKMNQKLIKGELQAFDHKQTMIKLEEICVNIQRQRDKQGIFNPEKFKSKSQKTKQFIKNRGVAKYKLENKSQIINKSKTEGNQPLVQSLKNQQYFAHKTERFRSEEEFCPLPAIQKSQNQSQLLTDLKRSPGVRYSLPSNLESIQKLKVLADSNLIGRKTIKRKKDQSRRKGHKISQRLVPLKLEYESPLKREQKNVLFESFQIKNKQVQPLLKGWDFQQDRYFSCNDQSDALSFFN